MMNGFFGKQTHPNLRTGLFIISQKIDREGPESIY